MAITDPIAATYVNATTFTATTDAAGNTDLREQCAVGVRIKADCGADGYKYGVVSSVSYSAPTTTIQITGDTLTANLVGFWHSNDNQSALVNHHHTGPDSGGNIFASSSVTQAGTSTDLAVTPAALAASAKGLVSSNTTIYVATTGSDTTGTGLVGAPFASISKALSSIAGKLIASGVIVTIQVADGTYTVSSAITIDHPDADKIQILGNTSAETTVAISSIDTTAKTITVAGDYTGSIVVGDIVGLTGSSTSGLNGAYIVSGRAYSGGNTVITCSAETFASATVGGGSIVIKPCNRCVLEVSSSIYGLYFTKSIRNLKGFRINASGATVYVPAIYAYAAIEVQIQGQLIISGGQCGVRLVSCVNAHIDGLVTKSVNQPIRAESVNSLDVASYGNNVIFDGASIGIAASGGSYVFTSSSKLIMRNVPTASSPAYNTAGNGNAYIDQ